LSNRDAAFNAKLAPKFTGPLEVRRIVSPVIVDVRDEKEKWYRHIHVKDFKPVPDDQPATDNKTDDDNPDLTDDE